MLHFCWGTLPLMVWQRTWLPKWNSGICLSTGEADQQCSGWASLTIWTCCTLAGPHTFLKNTNKIKTANTMHTFPKNTNKIKTANTMHTFPKNTNKITTANRTHRFPKNTNEITTANTIISSNIDAIENPVFKRILVQILLINGIVTFWRCSSSDLWLNNHSLIFSTFSAFW